FIQIEVVGCHCETIAQVLVANGIFPLAIPLLNLYRSLFARTCDAIHALANALNTTYERTGFRMLNNEGNKTKDPFRKSLGNAVQWYDVLLMRTEDRLEQALYEADQLVQARRHDRGNLSLSPLPSGASLIAVFIMSGGTCHLRTFWRSNPKLGLPPWSCVGSLSWAQFFIEFPKLLYLRSCEAALDPCQRSSFKTTRKRTKSENGQSWNWSIAFASILD
ncbi:hypothetical protein C8J56DRAFT_1097472, partial [Mycena floridula]